MKYRQVGASGLKVSEIAIGTWLTDLGSEEKVGLAKETIRLAYEKGINFFDCADAYGNGAAEQFLGGVLADFPRSKIVVSSKVYFPTGDGVNERGLSRKHIFDNVERSLKNLKMDYIDLYYCHRFDTQTPVEETLRALDDLVAQGKILYYGVSEGWTAARLERAQQMIEKRGLRPLTVIQPQYNMMDRYIEDEIMDVCERYGIGITPFSPLAQGLLTGKYKKGQPYPAGSRATHQKDKQVNRLLTEENLYKVEKLGRIAQELHTTPSVLALAWILRKECISSVITGASRPRQLEENVAASDLRLDPSVLREIEGILDYHPFYRSIG